MTPRAARSVLLAALAALAACGDAEAPSTDGGKEPAPTSKPAPPAEVRVLGVVPPFELTDQTGARFSGAQPSGRVWVVNFIFTRCRGTCPAQTSQLTALQNRLDGLEGGDIVRFLSISVDPEFDSPGVLFGYAESAQANQDVWTFLTGARDTIWDLAKTGFRLPAGDQPGTPEMPIFHSPKMVLVDTRGRIRGYYEGTTLAGVDELVRDMQRVLAEPRHFASNPGVIDAPWMKERAVA